MTVSYPACFYKEGNGYSVFVPDLGGATCGDSLEDSMRMAIDLIAGLIYNAKLDGEEISKPSAISNLDPETVYREMAGIDMEKGCDCFTTYVTLDPEEYARKHFSRSVKKTLSIPSWLNDQAVAAGINFSQILQKALKEQLGISD